MPRHQAEEIMTRHQAEVIVRRIQECSMRRLTRAWGATRLRALGAVAAGATASGTSGASGASGASGTTDGERGMVLVVVLWIVAALALLVVAFTASVHSNIKVVGSEIARARMLGALEAGVAIAAAHALASNKSEHWPADGEVRYVRYDGHRLAIRMRDTNSLIDLNKANGRLLYGLINQFVTSPVKAGEIRDRVLDWRDRDHNARVQGAEDLHYGIARRPYGAGDEEFMHVAQLQDVLGMDYATYAKLRPYLTVFGTAGRFARDGAPAAVLRALESASGISFDWGISGRGGGNIGGATGNGEATGVGGATRTGSEAGNAPTGPGAKAAQQPDSGATAKAPAAPGKGRRALVIDVALVPDSMGVRAQAPRQGAKSGNAQGAGAEELQELEGLGPRLQAVILLGADKESPYRVLAWSPN